MDRAGHEGTGAQAAHRDGIGHVVPLPVLLGVFLTLIALTIATVTIAGLGLSRFDFVIAMAIATVKAGLVSLYFMHLRYDRPFHAVVLVSALGFVALFISIALLDTREYRGDIERHTTATAGAKAGN